MILENLYPTDLTDSSGREYTKKIPEIPVTEPEFTDAYWLGWLAWENLPSTFIQSQIKRDSETNQITITPVTVPENIDIGYSMPVNTSSLPSQINPSFLKYDETQSKWVPWTTHAGNASELRLPNKYDINTSLVQDISLQFAAQISTTEDGNSLDEYIFSIGLDLDSFREFNNATFIVNRNTVSQEVGSLPNDLEFRITINELDGELHSITAGNYFVKIAMCSYGWISFERDIKPDGSVSMYSYPAPTIRTHTSAIVEDEQKDQTWIIAASRSTYLPAYNWLDGGGYRVALATGEPSFSGYSAPWDTSSYFMMGGYEGSYNGEDVRAALYNNTNLYKPEGANFFFQGVGRNDLAVIRRIYSYEDAYKHLALMPRMLDRRYEDIPFNNTYDNGTAANRYNKWYALVTANNEFTGKFISGEMTDRLKEWQLIGKSISPETSDYDSEKDKPEYIPEDEDGDTPDEGDWGANIPPGSGITFGTTAFSRFEMLNSDGVAEFLSKLWAAPQTFWEGLSINKQLAANLNDYILSFRAYPVDIRGNIPHHVIYIGASEGITLQQEVTTPMLVSDVPLGAIRISRQYNNFLDYNPYTSASIYLPFCGTCEINPKFLYDAQLFLTLKVDCTDGSGVWSLFRYGDDDAKTYPILIRQCRIGVDIPITGLDSSQMASNIVNATLQTGQHALSAVNKITGAAAQVGATLATGGAIGAETAVNLTTMGGELVLQGLADATNMAMANKEIPFYTAGSSGAAASVANPEPYITVRRPIVANPSTFAHTVGNLVNQSHNISRLSGYTVCRNVDVSGISKATSNERAQIKKIMESGFYA